jgi:hypothetical protein
MLNLSIAFDGSSSSAESRLPPGLKLAAVGESVEGH